jgi:hypothetical protein
LSLGSAAAVEDRIKLPFEEIGTELAAFQAAPFGCSLSATLLSEYARMEQGMRF